MRYAGLSEEVCTALQEDSPLPVPIQRLVGTGRVAGMVQLHQALPLVERQHALIEELRARAPRYVPGTVLAIRTGTTVRTVERSGWLVTSTPCRCGMAAAARRTSPTECRSRDHQLRYLTCVLGAELALWRNPGPDDLAASVARGIVQLLDWTCGAASTGPLTGDATPVLEVGHDRLGRGAACRQARSSPRRAVRGTLRVVRLRCCGNMPDRWLPGVPPFAVCPRVRSGHRRLRTTRPMESGPGSGK